MEVSTRPTYFKPGSEGLLSPLMHFIQDKGVSEILINKPYEVYIERQGVMEYHAVPQLDPMHLRRLFTFIANENKQNLSETKPLLSASLYDGSRVQLVIPPAARYYTLSIRRTSIQKRTLEDYKSSNFYERVRAFDLKEHANELVSSDEKYLLELYHKREWAEFIALAIRLKKNIVISGQTSSGKTTYLNACIGNIPHHERIITLEDTYEVDIPHKNLVSLCAPKKMKTKRVVCACKISCNVHCD